MEGKNENEVPKSYLGAEKWVQRRRTSVAFTESNSQPPERVLPDSLVLVVTQFVSIYP